MRRSILRSVWIPAALVAAQILGPDGAAAAAPQPASATAVWAWMVVRDPASATIGKLPGKDSGNSAGQINYVDHLGTGHYEFSLHGVGEPSGNVLVSALGTQPRVCLPSVWAQVSDFEDIEVYCFTISGVLVDTTFVVNWIAASGIGGILAYGRNFSPTDNPGSPDQSYMSDGDSIKTLPATNSIARWELPGFGSLHGTVQVTPFAHKPTDSPTTITAGVCDIVVFYLQYDADTAVYDEWVDLKCFDLNGTAQIYREHDMWYMRSLGMKGIDGTNVAYVFAKKPTTSSYTAPSAYSYSSAAGTNKIARTGVGIYNVTLPGMPRGGSAEVSAYLGDANAAPRHCVVASISKKTLPEQVGVRCFDLAGNLADSKFTLAYAR